MSFVTHVVATNNSAPADATPLDLAFTDVKIEVRARRLRLSQAFEDPYEAGNVRLTITRGDTEPTVAGTGSVGHRPIRFRSRTLANLESTNPGLTALIFAEHPWFKEWLRPRTDRA